MPPSSPTASRSSAETVGRTAAHRARCSATDPEAGTELEEGGALVLHVSVGNTLAPVPTDLVGKPIAEATTLLQQAGQFVAVPTEASSEDVPAGTVMAVGPEVPAELPKGSEVPLTVSSGPKPRTIPSGMAGRSYEEAAAALEAVQLVPVRVERFSDDVEAGTVIGLSPGEGTVPRGSEVEVVVSKGPDIVKVPAIAGRSLEEAIAALESAGLVVGDAFGPAKGTPFVTDPPAGTDVRRGSTVDIYLRR